MRCCTAQKGELGLLCGGIRSKWQSSAETGLDVWLLCAPGCYLGSGGTVLGADVRFWERKALSQEF